MYFETNNSMLYSDTSVPDVFITEYLPSLDAECLKVYLYILFLSKYNKYASPWELSKTLHIDVEKVKETLALLEEAGIIIKDEKKISMVDLKEQEIKKLYRLKTTSSPAEAIANNVKNKKRIQTVHAINEQFFQGLMSPSWYVDIDAWFERYKFDEDVMYTLFQHCCDHKGLAKNYIEKVADNWYNKGIKTSIDLDKYYMENQKTREIRTKIAKKLKLGRMLTEYEEELVENWHTKYNYDFDIIEIVLKRTTGKTSPNFNYINTILTDWNSKGLKTKDEIEEYTKKMEAKKTYETSNSNKQIKVAQHENFDQRSYAAVDYDKYYVNVNE